VQTAGKSGERPFSSLKLEHHVEDHLPGKWLAS
jgi:hypothetical protein